MGTTVLKKRIEDQLIGDYTRTISYMGRNNQTYTKTCAPCPRSIRINDIKQARLPKYSLTLGLFGSKYPCGLIQNNCDVRMNCPGLYECKICKKKMDEGILLCNSCGSVSHPPKFLGSHSYECKKCRRTVCRDCTFWSRKLLFFKTMMCEPCADLSPKSKRRLADK